MKKIIVLLILLLFCGFTPYTELNDLAIVDMIGLEKKENQYLLSLTTTIPKKEENKTSNQYKISIFKGKSLGEVFLKAKRCDNKTTYYDHLKVLLLDPKIFNQKTLSYLKKEFTQINYLVFAVDGDFSSLFKEYQSSNDFLEFVEKEKEEKKNITTLTFEDMLARDFDEEETAYLPLLSYQKKNLVVKGLKVLKSDLTLTSEDAKYNALLNKQITTYHKHYENYELEFKNLMVSTIYQNQIKIKINGTLSSSDTTEKKLKRLKPKVEKEIEKDIFSFYQKLRSNKIDTTFLKNTIYLKKRNKEKTNEVYQNAPLKINVTLGVDHNETK